MRCVVVAAGDVDPSDRALLDGASPLIAADAGAAVLLGWGIRPDHLIGDLDSLDARSIEELRQRGTAIHQRPEEKDESDTELALELALSFAPEQVVVLGALGGSRVDHELANVLLLADPRLRGYDVRIVRGPATLRVLHASGTLALEAPPGSTVTLLPLGADASGVTTRGLRYALADGTLALGRARGLSNVIEGAPASVRLGRGTLLVIETRAR